MILKVYYYYFNQDIELIMFANENFGMKIFFAKIYLYSKILVCQYN